MKSAHITPIIPEFAELKSLQYIPPEFHDNETFHIQSEALMHRIMSQPDNNAATVAPAKRFARARRAAIATAATLAIGLSGATAATAVGYSNPAGDWFFNRLAGFGIETSRIEGVSTEAGEQSCAAGWGVTNHGVIVLPERNNDNSTNLETISADQLLAVEILNGIDFNSVFAVYDDELIGVTHPTLENDGERILLSISTPEIQAWEAALNAEFDSLLSAAGLDAEQFAVVPLGYCRQVGETIHIEPHNN